MVRIQDNLFRFIDRKKGVLVVLVVLVVLLDINAAFDTVDYSTAQSRHLGLCSSMAGVMHVEEDSDSMY